MSLALGAGVRAMAKGKRRRFKPPVMLATVFRRAREVLDKRGWCKGEYEELDGSCCLVGAARVAAIGKPYAGDQASVCDRIQGELAEAIGCDYYAVTGWNDADTRRKRDVIALLKRAERKAAREKARLVP